MQFNLICMYLKMSLMMPSTAHRQVRVFRIAAIMLKLGRIVLRTVHILVSKILFKILIKGGPKSIHFLVGGTYHLFFAFFAFPKTGTNFPLKPPQSFFYGNAVFCTKNVYFLKALYSLKE